MSWSTPRHFNAPSKISQASPVARQQLHNGTVTNSSKPANLSNSAVLRMLQEQDDTQAKKEVIWPPPHSDEDSEVNYYSNDHQHGNHVPNGVTVQYRKPTFEPPPTTITLRTSPPISQSSPPVFRSQPATDTVRGGVHMLGDQKWPPPEYKKAAVLENEARIALARGPQFRPRKVAKDYTPFFARNALPNNYPGYKAPPGTQHYYEEPISNY